MATTTNALSAINPGFAVNPRWNIKTKFFRDRIKVTFGKKDKNDGEEALKTHLSRFSGKRSRANRRWVYRIANGETPTKKSKG